MKNDKVMSAISYGMFVLTARQGEKDNGCIINTVLQVTTQPNRIVFTVNKDHLTHDMVRDSGLFTLSILSEEASLEVYQRFGFRSGRDGDKFAGAAGVQRGKNGLMLVTQGANGWLSGRVISAQDLGSHTLFLADVEDGDVLSQAPSATYDYYQQHVKPKEQESAAGEKKRWVCKVCGYVYEGDALSADYVCPICKHPAEDFEPVG